MKVRLPMMIQDPRYAPHGEDRLVEEFETDKENFFLDGPVSARVAVLDFHPTTGKLEPGAVFAPPAPGRVLGRYSLDEKQVESIPFIQVNAFATVLKTMYMFEKGDVLGRRLKWAFDSPQLFVVPRAGQWENAYYERDTNSLQFYYFPNPNKETETIYTSLSRDVVSHEAGHAILDGIAPHLYNAISPQSLALHEGVADITALLLSFQSHALVRTVLKETNGSIHNSTAFSSIAEEFGMAMGHGALRNLLNDKTLSDVDPVEPHDLSEVLTGALYTLAVNLHDARKTQEQKRTGQSDYSVSGKALFETSSQLERMLLRSLDYLPPGEVSFADYGRAILAADQAFYPGDSPARDGLRAEFVKRKIVRSEADLDTPIPDQVLKDVNPEFLMDSDWAAYEFANQYRQLLNIPPGISFQVGKRLMAERRFWHRDSSGKPTSVNLRELIFKVWWNQEEPSGLDARFPNRRQITVGTTLAIDWFTRRVRLLLSCSDRAQGSEYGDQLYNRHEMARSLVDRGLIMPGRPFTGKDGRPLRSSVNYVATGDVMRIRGGSRLLHIV